MRYSLSLLAPTALALLLTACGDNAVSMNGAAANNSATPRIQSIEDNDSINMAGAAPAVLPTDAWVGRWVGPEGLFLDIQPAPDGKPGRYAIVNRDNLDREASYSGAADGETIRFTRDGKEWSIRPGTGDETGFKYLAGKTDCLIVEAGKEGYCR